MTANRAFCWNRECLHVHDILGWETYLNVVGSFMSMQLWYLDTFLGINLNKCSNGKTFKMKMS